jgi:penicillin-binding protein 1C
VGKHSILNYQTGFSNIILKTRLSNTTPAKKMTTTRWIKFGSVITLLLCFYFCLPADLFNSPTSFVLNDQKENLLGATIAKDGQWRFPYNEDVPAKFKACITTFEDKRFNYHPGIDPIALCRAIYQNLTGRKVVSGGSTISMQVIRLSRRKQRTLYQKLIEGIQAIRLEVGYSKKEILALYASNAPFGSNVVGLDAASWRYYGRSADKLSWGEMAALAVLPNAPTLVHPGKNKEILLTKRNQLLDKLFFNKTIDESICALAKMEPLPGKPLQLPMLTPHLLDRFKKDFAAQQTNCTKITTTIDGDLQASVTQTLERYHRRFKGNGINNIAAMVMEVESGNVLAYVGNVYHPKNHELESHVDVLASPRSPGSTLKPILFASMQSAGMLLPKQLVPDIPTLIGGYTPQNFNLEYDGAVPANKALSRSLNIPAVKMLQQYKYQRFYNVLQQCGFTTIKKPADHYGLSLILGGCEVTPFELAGVYSSMARSYIHQRENKGAMKSEDWFMPVYNSIVKSQKSKVGGHREQLPALNGNSNGTTDNRQLTTDNSQLPTGTSHQFLDYTSLWHTFNAMQEVMRPGEEGLWNLFNSAERIAWKTGTSFGFRDAWAMGLTPKYCVVVWVGNTDGEGRPELTGINTAAPVLFDLFRLLPASPWFEPPAYDFAYLPVCHQTGFKAGSDCYDVDTVLVSSKGKNAPLCPYHRIIHLDQTASYRVTENCEAPSNMVHQSWFVLPPGMEYYYKQRHSDYKLLPPFKQGCSMENYRQMELIYPDIGAKIYVPLEVSGEKGSTVFTAAHRGNDKIFWHLDNQYVGTTFQFHQMALNPTKGKHTLTLVDEKGESISRSFEIQEKEMK